MRGRVLSFQAMLWGVSGMSGFHVGAIANSFGAPIAIGIGGVVVTLAGIGLASSLESWTDRCSSGVTNRRDVQLAVYPSTAAFTLSASPHQSRSLCPISCSCPWSEAR